MQGTTLYVAGEVASFFDFQNILLQNEDARKKVIDAITKTAPRCHRDGGDQVLIEWFGKELGLSEAELKQVRLSAFGK